MATLAERVHAVYWFNHESENFELIACFTDEEAARICSEQFQSEKPNSRPKTLHHNWQEFCDFIAANRNPSEEPQ